MRYGLAVFLCLSLLACSGKAAPPQTPTVLSSTQADPEMAAAFQQARDTLDFFVQKIGTPHPDWTLVAVKVRFFPPGDSPQDIWVDGITYENGSFYGTMGDDIPTLKLSIGDKITIAREDVVDWAIVENGKLIGGYTIRLAVRRMSPQEKELFLKTLPYTIDD